MRVINIIDRLDKMNFGVWNAAVSTAKELRDRFGVQSIVWAPPEDGWNAHEQGVDGIVFTPQQSIRGLQAIVEKTGIEPNDTVIVTHGTWSFATRWGSLLKRKGYAWVHTPHGMLEPWCLKQKWIRKRVYGALFEFPSAARADAIRAVSTPEKENLSKLFPKHPGITLIPNGVDPESEDLSKKDYEKRAILFLSRLHHKKGVLPLVKAFASSDLANQDAFELIVGGPDQGELTKIKQAVSMSRCSNIRIIPPVFGPQKQALLRRCCYFALPSHSEGFPTAVVEAMSMGCIPIISKGCNFPEADHLALTVTPDVADIRNALDSINTVERETLQHRQQEVIALIDKGYTLPKIAELQYDVFRKLLSLPSLPAINQP